MSAGPVYPTTRPADRSRPGVLQRVATLTPLIAVGGYVGLLVASHYLPTSATTLRTVALVWLFGWGAIKFGLFYRQRRKARRRP